MFAQTLSAQSVKAGRKTRIHIEIDTGMGRAGFIYNDCLGDILSIAKLPGLLLEGIFTHFPSADGLTEAEKKFTMLQLERFSELVEKAKSLGLSFPVVHCANSAGCLYFPLYGNAVRPGLCVYGVQPNLEEDSPIELEPIITLKTQVVQLRDLPKGWGISYGRSFVTPCPLRIAVIRVWLR
jgi:alanine racemase